MDMASRKSGNMGMNPRSLPRALPNLILCCMNGFQNVKYATKPLCVCMRACVGGLLGGGQITQKKVTELLVEKNCLI